MDVVLLFSFESDSEPFHLLLRTGTCSLSTNPEYIFQPGKQPVKVKAKSLFCYWAVRELGFTIADLASKLNISQPAISMIAQSGEQIAPEYGYSLTDE